MGLAPILSFCLVLFLFCSQESKARHVSLEKACELAKSNSHTLQAAKQESESAKFQMLGHEASFYPKIDFSGEYRYIAEVPSLSIGQKKISLASHNNYSIGPTLRYLLYDFGARAAVHESLNQIHSGKDFAHKTLEAVIILNTENAYTDLQLANEKVAIAKESLKLSTKRYEDIKSRNKLGDASEVDFLSSQVEKEDAKIRLLQEENNQIIALTSLSQLLGEEINYTLELDTMTKVLEEAVLTDKDYKVNNNPQLNAAKSYVKSMEQQTIAQRTSFWPSFELQARAGFDYPNGPVSEKVLQKTIGIGFHWTLWDSGMRDHSVSQKAAETQALAFAQKNKQRELETELSKALTSFSSLKQQKTSIEFLVKRVEKLATISNISYELGKLALNEVITTNLKYLEVKMRKVQNDALLLKTYYRIKNLTKGDE